jgi:hypothetical protein
VPATDTQGEGRPDQGKTPPMEIREIENLEDDSKGG